MRSSIRDNFGDSGRLTMAFSGTWELLSFPRQNPGRRYRVTSTDEAGELVPLDPVEGRKNRKGVPDVGPWAGKYVRGFVLGITYHRHDPG